MGTWHLIYSYRELHMRRMAGRIAGRRHGCEAGQRGAGWPLPSNFGPDLPKCFILCYAKKRSNISNVNVHCLTYVTKIFSKYRLLEITDLAKFLHLPMYYAQ